MAHNGISWTMAPTCTWLSARGACPTPRNGRHVHTRALTGRAHGPSNDGRGPAQRGAIVGHANGQALAWVFFARRSRGLRPPRTACNCRLTVMRMRGQTWRIALDGGLLFPYSLKYGNVKCCRGLKRACPGQPPGNLPSAGAGRPGGHGGWSSRRKLGLAPNTLTFHFDRLRFAGLVTVRRNGRSMIYAARFETMNDLVSFLTENCCQGAQEKCAPVAVCTGQTQGSFP